MACESDVDCFLPRVHPEDPSSDDVPFVGLLNPRSGSRMGAVFLEEAARSSTYRCRLFDCLHVASDPEVSEQFRQQLEKAKEDAKRKNEKRPDRHCRPRLICGGGDGTASFALWCVFRALGTESGSSDWSEEDLKDYFPALVQMPLGTGNDFAGVLGWGRTIDPVHHQSKVNAWFKSAVSIDATVRPFDVWGLTPADAGKMKVCQLQGIDKDHPDRPQFMQSGPAVPFLSLLYFSLGYEAFVAAQVECNRTSSRFQNFIEYTKTIPSSMLGAQRRNINLTGVSISVPEGDDDDAWRNYLPPPHRESTGAEFTSVGFMNINSISGGVFKASNAAIADDGKMDFFRQKKYVKNILRRGLQFRTEKHSRAKFHIPASLPGVFCQYDGEGRFIFHPKQPGHVEFDVRRVMRIPVVLGPDAPRDVRGEPGENEGPVFSFVGADDEIEVFRQRLTRWVTGELATEMNATPEEIGELQQRADTFAQGQCKRRTRAWAEFGASLTVNACANCACFVTNHGCKGCQKNFCSSCFEKHLRNTPNFEWMHTDMDLHGLAKLIPMRWSSRLCFDDAIAQMEDEREGDQRPLLFRVYKGEGEHDEELKFDDAQAAWEWLTDYSRKDELENYEPQLEDHDGHSDEESDVDDTESRNGDCHAEHSVLSPPEADANLLQGADDGNSRGDLAFRPPPRTISCAPEIVSEAASLLVQPTHAEAVGSASPNDVSDNGDIAACSQAAGVDDLGVDSAKDRFEADVAVEPSQSVCDAAVGPRVTKASLDNDRATSRSEPACADDAEAKSAKAPSTAGTVAPCSYPACPSDAEVDLTQDASPAVTPTQCSETSGAVGADHPEERHEQTRQVEEQQAATKELGHACVESPTSREIAGGGAVGDVDVVAAAAAGDSQSTSMPEASPTVDPRAEDEVEIHALECITGGVSRRDRVIDAVPIDIAMASGLLSEEDLTDEADRYAQLHPHSDSEEEKESGPCRASSALCREDGTDVSQEGGRIGWKEWAQLKAADARDRVAGSAEVGVSKIAGLAGTARAAAPEVSGRAREAASYTVECARQAVGVASVAASSAAGQAKQAAEKAAEKAADSKVVDLASKAVGAAGSVAGSAAERARQSLTQAAEKAHISEASSSAASAAQAGAAKVSKGIVGFLSRGREEKNNPQ